MSNKVGAPHFMSLNSAQDENTFKALSATDGVDAGLKHQSVELQVCLVLLVEQKLIYINVYICMGFVQRTDENTQICHVFSETICF